MVSPKTLARIAGLFYLLMFGFSFFATGALNSVIVRDDAAATAGNIRASTALYRAGILADLVQLACFLLAFLALYMLLRHANQLVAGAMVVFAAIGVGTYALSLVNLVSAMNVATDNQYAKSLGANAANQLTLMYTSSFADSYFVPGMFFGLLLLALAYLVIKSGYFHVALGALLVLGGAGYIADTFARALIGGYGTGVTALLIPGAIAEAVLTLWLLILGVRLAAPAGRVAPTQRVRPTA